MIIWNKDDNVFNWWCIFLKKKSNLDMWVNFMNLEKDKQLKEKEKMYSGRKKKKDYKIKVV